MKKIDKNKIWKKTGLHIGDKEGLIELITRDVEMEALNDYFSGIDPRQRLTEDEFLEIVDDRLHKWSINKLLLFWEAYSYK